MIQKILVAVDGSHHADHALAMAAEIARRFDADLVLSHCLIHGHLPDELRALSDEDIPEMPPMSLGGASVDYQVPRRALESIAGKLLENAADKARKAGVNNVTTSWGDGDPAQVILESARNAQADLIVMGSRGLGDLKGLLLGSVSHKVQQLFEGSVLTVR